MENPYKAYFDRTKGQLDGKFSIVDSRTGHKPFNQLPVRSGQRGYLDTSWQTGKSPIPYSQECKYTLRIDLRNPLNYGTFPTGGGIGEFWHIYNSPSNDTNLIIGKENGQIRNSCGCHPENIYPGSAGCIVFLWDTEARKKEFMRFSIWLRSLSGLYEYLPLEVL
jgi:hypothetical protein